MINSYLKKQRKCSKMMITKKKFVYMKMEYLFSKKKNVYKY